MNGFLTGTGTTTPRPLLALRIVANRLDPWTLDAQHGDVQPIRLFQVNSEPDEGVLSRGRKRWPRTSHRSESTWSIESQRSRRPLGADRPAVGVSTVSSDVDDEKANDSDISRHVRLPWWRDNRLAPRRREGNAVQDTTADSKPSRNRMYLIARPLVAVAEARNLLGIRIVDRGVCWMLNRMSPLGVPLMYRLHRWRSFRNMEACLKRHDKPAVRKSSLWTRLRILPEMLNSGISHQATLGVPY